MSTDCVPKIPYLEMASSSPRTTARTCKSYHYIFNKHYTTKPKLIESQAMEEEKANSSM